MVKLLSVSPGILPTAPDSGPLYCRLVTWLKGLPILATQEGSLGNNDQIQLADLDYAKEAAKTLTPPIRPAQIEGGEYYVVILHPYQVTDIRLDVANSVLTLTGPPSRCTLTNVVLRILSSRVPLEFTMA